jgi:hypothetical protein
MDFILKGNRNFFYILFTVAMGIWILNGYTIIALIAPHSTSNNVKKSNDDIFSKAFALADSALKCKPKTGSFEYSGVFENPFRLLAETFAAPAKKKNSASSLGRIKLVLKGVLLKEKPLAILEDEKGKTFICGIGEKISEDAVESIEANRVTLRGSQGSYTLTVKE